MKKEINGQLRDTTNVETGPTSFNIYYFLKMTFILFSPLVSSVCIVKTVHQPVSFFIIKTAAELH